MSGRYLTAAEVPVQAGFRREPEDFVVEEVPAYEPSGEGTHTYLFIEKRGISTDEAVRRLARTLGRRPSEVGYAGRKDARALTRQWLSIEHVRGLDASALEVEGVRILQQGLHRNKLRRGHLRGNRFHIRLRDVSPAGVAVAGRVMETLASRGVPNRFGPQRFGSLRATTAELGRALLEGEVDAFLSTLLGQPRVDEAPRLREARERYEQGELEAALGAYPRSFMAERAALVGLLKGGTPAAAVRAVPGNMLRLYVSAAQSQVFNLLLDERLDAGTTERLEPGDVAWLHRCGACFLVTAAEEEAPRAAAFEISPAGPLFGTKLLAAEGEPGARERAAFASWGVPALDQGRRGGGLVKLPKGARRPYRVPLGELSLTPEGDDLLLRFALPPGSYATAVIAEILKREVA